MASVSGVAAILVTVYMLSAVRRPRPRPWLTRYIPPLLLAGLIGIVFSWSVQYRRAEIALAREAKQRSTPASEATAERSAAAPMPSPAAEPPPATIAPPVPAEAPSEPSVAPQPPSVAPTLAEPDVAATPAALPHSQANPPGNEPPPTQHYDGVEKFAVVPVFFGTDRERVDNDQRADYGAGRGRRLEIGRALVSVPASHEGPDIERPWTLRIPYFDVKIYEQAEDPDAHFTLRDIRTVPREEFLALVAERLAKSSAFKDHALVFVHGFNTSFDNAIYRTAQITHDLKFDGAAFLYSWPSGGMVSSYTYDRDSAGQSEPYLREFLEIVVKESKAQAVNVIAHSMGSRPLLEVIRDMKASAPAIAINQLILAAPDVDRDSFATLAREIKGFAKGITLYAAANDRALDVSRRYHGGITRAGDVPAAGPVVAEGVDTIDVTAISTDSLGLNYSEYVQSNALLADIGLLLQTGDRPPGRRVPELLRIGTPNGEYWRYRGP